VCGRNEGPFFIDHEGGPHDSGSFFLLSGGGITRHAHHRRDGLFGDIDAVFDLCALADADGTQDTKCQTSATLPNSFAAAGCKSSDDGTKILKLAE
jgi:hypothetical protein